MNVLVAGLLLWLAATTLICGIALVFDSDAAFTILMVSLFGGLFVVCVVGAAIVLMGGDKPAPVVGHCYQAAQTQSYVVVPSGKTFVPIVVNGVQLMEISCP